MFYKHSLILSHEKPSEADNVFKTSPKKLPMLSSGKNEKSQSRIDCRSNVTNDSVKKLIRGLQRFIASRWNFPKIQQQVCKFQLTFAESFPKTSMRNSMKFINYLFWVMNRKCVPAQPETIEAMRQSQRHLTLILLVQALHLDQSTRFAIFVSAQLKKPPFQIK